MLIRAAQGDACKQIPMDSPYGKIEYCIGILDSFQAIEL